MARKRRLDIQKQTKELLASPLSEADDELRRELEARGVEPNGAGALLYVIWEKALEGDLKAAIFLKDLAGTEEPKEKTAKKAPPIDLQSMSDEELMALQMGAEQ